MVGQTNDGQVAGTCNRMISPVGGPNGGAAPSIFQHRHAHVREGQFRSQTSPQSQVSQGIAAPAATILAALLILPELSPQPQVSLKSQVSQRLAVAAKVADTAVPTAVSGTIVTGLSGGSALAAPAATIFAAGLTLLESISNAIECWGAMQASHDQSTNKARNYIRGKAVQRPRNRLIRNGSDMVRMLFSGTTGVVSLVIPASVVAALLGSVVAPLVSGIIAGLNCGVQAWEGHKLSQRREYVRRKIEADPSNVLFDKPDEVKLAKLGRMIDQWLIKSRDQKIGGKDILTSIYGIAGSLGIAGGALGITALVAGAAAATVVATGGLVLAAMTAVFLAALAVWGGICLYQWFQNRSTEKELRMEWEGAQREREKAHRVCEEGQRVWEEAHRAREEGYLALQAKNKLEGKDVQEIKAFEDPILQAPFRLEWNQEDGKKNAVRKEENLKQESMELDPDESTWQFLSECLGPLGSEAPDENMRNYLKHRCEEECAPLVEDSISLLRDQWKSSNAEEAIKTFRGILKF